MSSNSMVAAAAEKFRRDALKVDEGTLLGSEETLLERYGVSRPTLRQAASLVAQEQLVVIRRGVGGGYFARRPEPDAVSRIAAVYLKAHGAPVSEIIAAFMPIRIELARLAVHCTDDEMAQLTGFLAREADDDGTISLRSFLAGERKFNSLLGKIGGNRALELFLQITLDLAALIDREEDMYRNHPERMTAMRAERNRLAHAITERDEELAILIARRCARMSSQWLLDDAARRTSQGIVETDAMLSYAMGG